MPNRTAPVLLAFLLLPLAAPPAQGPGPEVMPDRLVVKLVEGTGAVLAGDALQSRTGTDLAAVAALFARARVERAIRAPLDLLDAWHARAVAVLPAGKAPGHLGLWFYLACPDAAAAAALRRDLLECPLVEHCYPQPVHRPSGFCNGNDPPPPTPDFRLQQVYHGAAPSGLGIWTANGVLGGRGRGVNLCSVEDDWYTGHEDLSRVNPGAFLGVAPPGSLATGNHGVAGSSVMCADRNCFGLTGAADEVSYRMVSQLYNGFTSNALILAAVACQPGDVIMVAMQYLLGQLGPDDWVPVEYSQLEFDATLTVTSNGRLVVVSAANGNRSLDDPRHLRRFDRGYRDSGAIFVAATLGGVMTPATFTNYGSRIDANGWGEFGIACGYGTLFFGGNLITQSYTAGYAGTSLAVPLVTGTVAALQGAARRQLGRSLTTAEVRQLILAHGTPATATIGARPDLKATMRALGILDGLELSHPDVAPGSAINILLSGPVGGGAILFASLSLQDANVGLNRPIHLQLGTIATMGFVPLFSGGGTFPFAVPNNQNLLGVDLYFQAGTFGPTPGPIHVTNSGHVSVW